MSIFIGESTMKFILSAVSKPHTQVLAFGLILLSGLSVTNVSSIASAQGTPTQNNIQRMGQSICDVKAGKKKPDRQTLQFMTLLDHDFGEANPITYAVQMDVLRRCPKAFLRFNSRQRAVNPLGNLIVNNNVRLLNSGGAANNQQASLSAADYSDRAFERYKKGDMPGAIEDLNQSISLKPNDSVYYFNRGFVYEELGEHQKAIADYNQSIILNPKFALAYSHRSIVRQSLGDKKGAIADYNQAIKLDPKLRK